MVLKLFRGSSSDRLDHVEALVQQMLADDRHSFDAATSALIGGASAAVVRPDLIATDRRVNEAEREIRRELVVHASVHENVDVPGLLVYMSIVKDLERIGDYAKNILDVAEQGIDFSDADDLTELLKLKDRVSLLISQTAGTFQRRDVESAKKLLSEGDDLTSYYDDLVDELIRGEGAGDRRVARALFYRHCKRIVAHLLNVLSAIVVPIDQLDYYDEDPETRD